MASAEQLVAPCGSSRAVEDVPFCFCGMDASWAFVVSGSFDPVRMSTNWKKIMGKFDDEYLGAVLASGKGFPWYFPIDGFEGMSGPVVPFHGFWAKPRAASCVSESLGCGSTRET